MPSKSTRSTARASLVALATLRLRIHLVGGSVCECKRSIKEARRHQPRPPASRFCSKNSEPAHVASLVPGATVWSRRPYSCATKEAGDDVMPSSDGPEPTEYRAHRCNHVVKNCFHGHFALAQTVS
ncbi:hypothetical protein EVAR_75313_1 [Eumeta japonica]|uniref:Secreted protein n=1 Tax=Eumeta variegata TaxID=151549 RepID=A0A4C1Y2E1_EUMVA|nr:hypothetical protein EVAR_75313_1 [Eumeta japonica]